MHYITWINSAGETKVTKLKKLRAALRFIKRLEATGRVIIEHTHIEE